MAIPYTQLWAKFETLANDLIEEVNATTVILYFAPATLTSINSPQLDGNGGDRPNIFDALGGRVPITTLPERQNESGSNLSETPQTRTIKSRVYWNKVNRNKDIGAINTVDRKDTCKIISYFSDQQDLLNAIYINVDGYKCKRIADPVPHGLGGRLYVTSFWEIIQ